MAEETTTTTSATPESQPAAGDGAPAEPQAQSVIDPPSEQPGPTTTEAPATTDGGDAQMQRILDPPKDETPQEAPKDAPRDKPDGNPGPEAEAYKALVEGADKAAAEIVVGKSFEGDEVRFGAAELKALYPALQKAGVPADKAGAVAECVAALQGARLKADNERYVKAINARADECREKFGADLGRVKANAVKGLNMMDKSLRDEIYATPVLVNDHRFLSFLAMVGEKFAIDDGGGAGAQPKVGDGRYNPGSWFGSSRREE